MELEFMFFFLAIVGMFIICFLYKIHTLTENEGSYTANEFYKPFDIQKEYERVNKEQAPITPSVVRIKPALSSTAPRHEWTKLTPHKENVVINIKNHNPLKPQKLSQEAAVLEHLNSLSNEVFQEVILALCEKVLNMKSSFKEYMSPIKTSFLFSGVMNIEGLIPLQMDYIGEVRKSEASTPVEMKHINRILNKLNRGQMGLYITTSYFTGSAQQEIKRSRSSIKLISGLDLVKCLTEHQLIEGNQIKSSWIDEICNKEKMSA
ncbi:restriction endonuclease [Chengkuizengella sediminis]|uniref:restriction endonuclease n=1 Tax=Chengkuizengella sediminis TaxID=1885917 RepID=UPI00138A56EB|nr:restriction endonuclease [Chengkuizengella sediminis]NDI34903.1 hypothetical protein [Chengkuizengella sediminis]